MVVVVLASSNSPDASAIEILVPISTVSADEALALQAPGSFDFDARVSIQDQSGGALLADPILISEGTAVGGWLLGVGASALH